jgi:Holliday junction resolvasome RuvABC endonuclease subunit
MDKVLGVDPGLTGALAVVSKDGSSVAVWDVPVFSVQVGRKNRNELDLHKLDKILKDIRMLGVSIAYVEKVSSMPQQGVSSTFSFGRTYGSLLMGLVCNGFVLEHVTPNVWKKSMKVRKGKESSVLRASELLPSFTNLWNLKKHHNRAEAALIASYGLGLVPKRARLIK